MNPTDSREFNDIERRLASLQRQLSAPTWNPSEANLPSEIVELRLPWKRLRGAAMWEEKRRQEDLRLESWEQHPRARRVAEFLGARPEGASTVRRVWGSMVCLASNLAVVAFLLGASYGQGNSTRLLAVFLSCAVSVLMVLMIRSIWANQGHRERDPAPTSDRSDRSSDEVSGPEGT